MSTQKEKNVKKLRMNNCVKHRYASVYNNFYTT